MGMFRKTKGTLDSEYFTLKSDLAHLKNGDMYDVQMLEDCLNITSINLVTSEKGSIKLRYDQIKSVSHGVEAEIVEKDRSAIGRAVAGGLLFGGVGAVVGATSAAGRKKEKKEYKTYFIIEYISSSGEEDFIVFLDERNYHGKKFAKHLAEHCGIDKEKEPQIQQEFL